MCFIICTATVTNVVHIFVGLALLQFKERINKDPYGVFANWDPDHLDPCMWLGVHCLNGKVQKL